MAEIHNVKQRMPTILQREDIEAWLAGSTEDARAALKQYPADSMVAWQVSRRVNTPRNNHASLIERQLSGSDISRESTPDPSVLDPGEPILE